MSADAALIAGAALLGLAGTPHCAAMCAGPCAVASAGQGPAGPWAFHAARVAGYAGAGAVAAASVAALASLAQWAPVLRPLWSLLQAAMLGLGLWMVVTGRQPAWMGAMGRVPSTASGATAGWQPLAAPGLPARAVVAGGLWAAWPCGLLQSALLMASLAGSAPAGALAMAIFALTSSAGLVLAPWAWRRLRHGGGGMLLDRHLVRAAGLMLAVAALYAMGHGMWSQLAAWCGLG